jgi:integrase
MKKARDIFLKTICNECGKDHAIEGVRKQADVKALNCTGCGSLDLRLGTKYFGYVPNSKRPGNVKAMSLKTSNATEAAKMLRKIWHDADNGHMPKNRTTFDTVWTHYKNKKLLFKSGNTQTNYTRNYALITEALVEQGIKDPNNIPVEEIEYFLNDFSTKHSNAYANACVKALKTVLRDSPFISEAMQGRLSKIKLLPESKASRHIQPRLAVKAAQYLYSKWQWLGMVSYLILQTGLRVNDATSIRWDSINFDTGRLKLTPKKTSKHYTYVSMILSDACIETLKDWKKKQKDDSPFVFPSPKKPDMPRCGKAQSNNIKKAQKKLGIDFDLQRFRDTFGTQYYRGNKDIVLTSRHMGHTDIKTTMKYVEALADDDWDMEGLPENFFDFRLTSNYNL